MADEPPYILDLDGVDEHPDEHREPEATRPWIGVRFECCGVYTRIYRNTDGTAYVGQCPRCARRVRVRVGPEGTNHRMFRAH